MTAANFAPSPRHPEPFPMVSHRSQKVAQASEEVRRVGSARLCVFPLSHIALGNAACSPAKLHFALINRSGKRKREKSFRTSPFSKTSPRSYFFFLAGFLAAFFGAFFLVAI
jgi:hypothetical protein